jgi:glycosyltransferase involved in cell wall biosynthesis
MSRAADPAAPRRRLLILAYFYPPLAGGGVHRVLGFTRYLPRHGWACTVVCAGEEDYWVRDATLLDRVPPGTEILRASGGSALATLLKLGRGGGTAPRSRRAFAGLRRLSDWWLLPDSYRGWAGRAAAVAARRIARGGVDAVLSSSPPDSAHLAARTLRRRFRLPWVADFRDPWIGLSFRTPPTAWHRARQAAMERAVLGGADLVLTASRTHADDLRRRAGGNAAPDAVAIPGRLEHLPNGFEPEAEGERRPDSGSPDSGSPDSGSPDSGSTSFFTLVFAGTLSQMPDADVFLEALHDLLARRPEARRRIRAQLAGPYERSHKDRAEALGLTGVVRFPGSLPHAETRALERGADLLLLWKPRGAGYRTMVPGKLYEYLDVERPVLAMLPEDDEAAALVRSAGGEVVPPGDRAPLAAAIERRYLAWKEGRRERAARPEWLDGHTRARLAERLAGLLDALPERKG